MASGRGATVSAVTTTGSGASARSAACANHRAGEKLFIDYCGPTVPIVDTAMGELRQAQVFVTVLGAFNYTYAEATWTQSLPDWIASHQRAFQFFGGTVDLLVPDNLRSGVTTACRYDPQPNAAPTPSWPVIVWLRHPAGTPLQAQRQIQSGGAGVQVVERWILARLRHQTFFSLSELNGVIGELLTDLNARPFQKLPGSGIIAHQMPQSDASVTEI